MHAHACLHVHTNTHTYMHSHMCRQTHILAHTYMYTPKMGMWVLTQERRGVSVWCPPKSTLELSFVSTAQPACAPLAPAACGGVHASVKMPSQRVPTEIDALQGRREGRAGRKGQGRQEMAGQAGKGRAGRKGQDRQERAGQAGKGRAGRAGERVSK